MIKTIHLPMILTLLMVLTPAATAQTTEFTYQGRLVENGVPVTGAYDLEFRLFAVETGGAALAVLQRPNVAVASGVFTVRLDFGANFDGAARYLEIAAKRAGSANPLTVLAPRQSFATVPYAIRSLDAATADNAARLGGTAASQFVQTGDARLSDARNPLPNSPNYINNTTAQQASSNFNISGTGTANVFDAATQFNIGGSRVLGVSSFSQNVFAGVNAGAANGAGGGNSFFGQNAGQTNVSGANNSFFGRNAGQANTANNNSFFGESAGFGNSTGTRNAFFGQSAGRSNTTGTDDAFFGYRAGFNNTASFNSFFGSNAGDSTTTGQNNAFFGYNAGQANLTGTDNSFFGSGAGAQNTASFNAFFGSRAGNVNTAGTGNSFFGADAGLISLGGFNSFFGTSAGGDTTTGFGNSFFGNNAGRDNAVGNDNSFFGRNAGSNNAGSNNTAIGSNTTIGLSVTYGTAIGAGSVVYESNSIALGRENGLDKVVIYGLGNNGSADLCRNSLNQIALCSSSLRYKTNVQAFYGGLDVVRRLRPITFNWKAGGMADVGFAAEEVNAIEPLLTTTNAQGEIEGVKYKQLATVLVNAVNEQETKIERLTEQLKAQQQQIELLKKLVCAQNPQAEVCR
ncbi:MAG: tail fiber domain-containing protein [Acidobacteria bacterium]|nr:tail fiber domain-containing protein [Acidobacteriota bacterium]